MTISALLVGETSHRCPFFSVATVDSIPKNAAVGKKNISLAFVRCCVKMKIHYREMQQQKQFDSMSNRDKFAFHEL